MSELVAFLSARLDEDEAVARAATPGPWDLEDFGGDCTVGSWDGEHDGRRVIADAYLNRDGVHVARFDPARVLAEVDTKRQMVGLFTRYRPNERAIQSALRLLALPYADHPDYRQEWTP